MNKAIFPLHLLAAIAVTFSIGTGCSQAAETTTTAGEATMPVEDAKTEVKTNADGAPIDAPEGPQPTRTVVYKTTVSSTGKQVELVMNIFEPEGHKPSDKTPAIVFFFGGGWNDGKPKSFFPHCAYFASRGMVAFAPDYRVKNRQKTTPYESVADGKSAIRYVRANAKSLGIDPDRIAAAGSSAGAHVAASAGIVPGLEEPTEDASVSSVPNALILYNPVIDTSEKGYGNARLGERWKEISPQHHVRAGLPPTITFHGDADKTVPYENAVAFDQAMRDAKNRSELVTFNGVGHGFVYQLSNKSATRATIASDVFLESLGYIKGAPTLPPK